MPPHLMEMPLFNGVLLNGLQIANANLHMAQKMDESTRNQIVFEVVSTYLGVLQAVEVSNLQQEYLDLSRLNYEKAERLKEAGRYSTAEAMRWLVEFQQQKSTVVSSESAVRSVQTALARLLNLDMRRELEIEDRIPQHLLAESELLAARPDSAILAMIQLDDAELVQVNAALDAAKSSARLSKLLYRNTYASYLPNVSLSYSYGWRENNTLALDDYSPKTVMINFSLPLFTSFQNYTANRSAYYEYKQSRESYADQLLNTRFVLTETVNKILNLKTQRQLSRTNVEYTEHNYRIVEQQREKGLVSNIDFIDAKLNLQNARLTEINTQYDFIAAMVELYYLLGQLDRIAD